MFYLEQAFKLIRAKWPSFIFFIILGISVIGLTIWGNEIFNYLGMNAPKIQNNSYFHALINDNENHSRLARRLQELPGVKNVEILAKEDLKKEVETLLRHLGILELEDVGALNYVGIKVVFHSGVSDRSESLIRDYLIRLVGSEKVTLGDVKRPYTALQIKKDMEGLNHENHWWKTGTIICAAIFWLFALLSLLKEALGVGTLADKFRRNKNSGVKIFSVLMLMVNSLLILSIVAIHFNINWKIDINYTHLGIIGILFFIGSIFCYKQKKIWQKY